MGQALDTIPHNIQLQNHMTFDFDQYRLDLIKQYIDECIHENKFKQSSTKNRVEQYKNQDEKNNTTQAQTVRDYCNNKRIHAQTIKKNYYSNNKHNEFNCNINLSYRL